MVSLSPLLSDDLQALAANITDPGKLADFIASSLTTIGTPVKQEVLETLDIRARMDSLNRILIKELEVLELGSKIQSQVQSEVGKNQREYFLREQLKAIQKELGEGDDQAKEIDELRAKIDAAGMPEAVKKEATARAGSALEDARRGGRIHRIAHLPRLARGAPVGQADRGRPRPAPNEGGPRRRSLGAREGEGPRHRVPCCAQAESRREGARSSASLALPESARPRWQSRSPIRSAASSSGCRSAACATKRKSAGTVEPTSARCRVRSSRGFGAPNRRIPVFILDEIDKLGSDFRGDPASALLEVLDPEQNNTFRDHYLDVPFDLSEVLFLTTANVMDPIPPALRDRMEVLELAGYTEEEKLKIAVEHLITKQIGNHGLTGEQVDFTEPAIRALIRGYTREAGVRNLEREIGALCRKVARRRAEGDETPVVITHGRRRRDARRADVPRRGDRGPHEGSRGRGRARVDARRRRGPVHRGVAHAGRRQPDPHRAPRRRHEGVGADGALLVPRERAALQRRSGVLQGCGNPPARPVGRDSKGRALGRRHDGHGAGLRADRAPGRGDLAMTGEITLSGRVLPVGGIKEKVLAARRHGITEVILPRQNEKNIKEDLTEELRRELTIHYVAHIEEVLAIALMPSAAQTHTGMMEVEVQPIAH